MTRLARFAESGSIGRFAEAAAVAIPSAPHETPEPIQTKSDGLQHTFEIDRCILGHSETRLWTLTFDGNKVDVAFENTDGTKARLHGEIAD